MSPEEKARSIAHIAVLIATALKQEREKALEDAAKLIDENDEYVDNSPTAKIRRGVSPRSEDNQSGLGYAAAIRALKEPSNAP